MAIEHVCDRCGCRAVNPTGWKSIIEADLGELCPGCVQELKTLLAGVDQVLRPVTGVPLQDADGGRRGD